MAAYATVDQLEAGWRPLTDAERTRAAELIDRASAYLDSIIDEHGIDAGAKAAALRIVCCDMVQRKMEAAAIAPVSSVTQQAGGFAQTTSYAHPVAKGWKLWPEDLALLGVKPGRARFVKVAVHDGGGDQVDW